MTTSPNDPFSLDDFVLFLVFLVWAQVRESRCQGSLHWGNLDAIFPWYYPMILPLQRQHPSIKGKKRREEIKKTWAFYLLSRGPLPTILVPELLLPTHILSCGPTFFYAQVLYHLLLFKQVGLVVLGCELQIGFYINSTNGFIWGSKTAGIIKLIPVLVNPIIKRHSSFRSWRLIALEIVIGLLPSAKKKKKNACCTSN